MKILAKHIIISMFLMSLFGCKKQPIYTTSELNGKVFEKKFLLNVETIKFSGANQFYMSNTGKPQPSFTGIYSLQYYEKKGVQEIHVTNNNNDFSIVFEIKNKSTIQLKSATPESYLTNKDQPASAFHFQKGRKYKLVKD